MILNMALAHLFGPPILTGLTIARQIEAGMTFINGAGQSNLGYELMPFGGVKQSGIGRENSTIGLAEFIEYHAINYHK